MHIFVITLFPEMFQSVFEHSIPKRALNDGKVEIKFVNLRDFGIGRHKVVDDTPYGGGAGMVLRVDVLENAISQTRKNEGNEKVILLDPKGKKYSQVAAQEYSQLDQLILVCGRYEGFDERVRNFIDEEISIGDYILSGGEIPAMVIVDSVIRLLPGVLKKEDATQLESFSEIEGKTLLESPVYTKPSVYKGLEVPKILKSGDKKLIDEYKKTESLKLTKARRPDILEP